MAEEEECIVSNLDAQAQDKANDILSVKLHKESKHISVGISMKGAYPEIVITQIRPGSLCSKTGLEPGMLIESVNGKTFSVAKDVSNYLAEAVGDVQIKAVRNIATASVYKPKNDFPVGIVFQAGPEPIIITKIADSSPLVGSEIAPGMVLVRINGQSFATSQQAAAFLKDSHGKITIEARKNYSEQEKTQPANTKAATVVPLATARPPPPGVPSGGEWVRSKYHGPTSCVWIALGCLCLGLPAILCLLCPCDVRDVYIVVSDKAGCSISVV